MTPHAATPVPMPHASAPALPPASHVHALARQLHDDWRRSYQVRHGAKPRLKITSDRDWATQHRSDRVDLSHSEFDDLPQDWQQENLASAQVALELVERAALGGVPLADDFVERAAFEVHRRWRDRNRDGAASSQDVGYERLSEAEKEKDRQQVRAAIKLYQEGSAVDMPGLNETGGRQRSRHQPLTTIAAIGLAAIVAGIALHGAGRR